MAKRPVFLPFTDGSRLVRELTVEFDWSPGFAPVQKKKNIAALHQKAAAMGFSPLLEVSTKSDLEIGRSLSAFNLSVELDDGSRIPLECAFQGSKVFDRGGPYTDLYRLTSREAKKDERLRSGGGVKGFRFEGVEFSSEPKTAFYDWLYVRSLTALKHDVFGELERFAGFTDIEFNPGQSINCQARSCALFVALCRKGLLEDAIASPARFIQTVSVDSFAQPYSDDVRQGRLF
jgi:hypothetical protein